MATKKLNIPSADTQVYDVPEAPVSGVNGYDFATDASKPTAMQKAGMEHAPDGLGFGQIYMGDYDVDQRELFDLNSVSANQDDPNRRLAGELATHKANEIAAKTRFTGLPNTATRGDGILSGANAMNGYVPPEKRIDVQWRAAVDKQVKALEAAALEGAGLERVDQIPESERMAWHESLVNKAMNDPTLARRRDEALFRSRQAQQGRMPLAAGLAGQEAQKAFWDNVNARQGPHSVHDNSWRKTTPVDVTSQSFQNIVQQPYNAAAESAEKRAQSIQDRVASAIAADRMLGSENGTAEIPTGTGGQGTGTGGGTQTGTETQTGAPPPDPNTDNTGPRQPKGGNTGGTGGTGGKTGPKPGSQGEDVIEEAGTPTGGQPEPVSGKEGLWQFSEVDSDGNSRTFRHTGTFSYEYADPQRTDPRINRAREKVARDAERAFQQWIIDTDKDPNRITSRDVEAFMGTSIYKKIDRNGTLRNYRKVDEGNQARRRQNQARRVREMRRRRAAAATTAQ